MAAAGATRASVSLGWPMFIRQLAVMANGIIDTMMAGHLSPRDLASVAIGSSIYCPRRSGCPRYRRWAAWVAGW
jgi:Na+-driven multidrug efflux pump